MLTVEALARSERDLNANEVIRQIGQMNVLAISGGRVVRDSLGGVTLPVSHGYSVRVTLAANDTYTVERVFTRRKKGVPEFKVYRLTDVYAEEVGEAAYQASCYVNVEFGEVVVNE